MAENSKIEWTNHTVNLWWGCTKVHAGCDNCYAETLSNRFGGGIWGEGTPRKNIKSSFKDLSKYQKLAAKDGVLHKVFVGSMMDIFEKSKPMCDHRGKQLLEKTGDKRDILFQKISDNEYPNLVFLFLTKRPSNINKMIPDTWKDNPPKNVWFGCSPVDQKTYNNFFNHMMHVNGNTFYSVEPQLGDVFLNSHDKVNWIIQGGESGSNRRPFDLCWAVNMKKQCSIYNIPYFFKQIDKVQDIPKEHFKREFPDFQKAIYESV